MARGGGGGGGGGHSSHSSSSGGGRSYRSSGSGSRGGGSRGSSGHSYGGGSRNYYGPTYVNHSYNGGVYRSSGSSLMGLISGIVTLIIIGVILFSLAPSAGTNGITRSTIERQPLDKQYVQTGDGQFFRDDIGWIGSPNRLNKDLRYFYEKTGVWPYLVITETVYGSYSPSGEDVMNYAEEIYRDRYTDEGHMVFVFQSQDNSDYYMMGCYTGAQANLVIDTYEATEILYDYLDSYWWADKDEEAFFGDAFADAADRIMKVTPNYAYRVVVVIGIVVVLLILLAITNKIIKRKKEKAAETERLLNTPLEHISASEE